MSTHNIDFYKDLTKIIFELSSYTHLISSAAELIQRDFNDNSLSIGVLTRLILNMILNDHNILII